MTEYESPLRCSLLVAMLCALAAESCASHPEPSQALEREIEFVSSAFKAASGSGFAMDGPKRGLHALVWTARLQTTQSPTLLFGALLRSLERRYTCKADGRQVWCSRALPGDLLLLEVLAQPGDGETTLLAQLKALAH